MSINFPSTAEFRSRLQPYTESRYTNRHGGAHSANSPPTDFEAFRHILESFNIPFIVVSVDGREAFRSSDADKIPDADVVWAQAAHLATMLIVESPPRQRTSLGIISASLHGATLHARLATLDGEMVAVVAVRPTLPSGQPAVQIATTLTPRENEVARLMACGKSVKQVAASLAISIHTARRHAERIYQKLGIQTRAQLVLIVERAINGTGVSTP